MTAVLSPRRVGVRGPQHNLITETARHRALIQAMWAAGKTAREIAAAIEWKASSPGRPDTLIRTWRDHGCDLPPRSRPGWSPRRPKPPATPKPARPSTLTCLSCGEHLLRPSPDGLCGFCQEERMLAA